MPEKKMFFSNPVVRQSITIIAVLLLLVGGLYYFLGYGDAPPTRTTASGTAAEEENLIFSSGSIFEKQDGKNIWELHAESIVTNVRTKKAQLSKVNGKFYGEEEMGQLTLAAENAVLDTVAKTIELNDKVRLTGQGATLNAPAAKWDGSKFFASGGIDLRKEDLVITGENMEASPDLETVTIKGRARLVKGVSENER